MAFTDPRLPGREYKTERGLKLGLSALEKRQLGANVTIEVPLPAQPTSGVAFVAPEAAPEPTQVYIRNLHHGPCRFRIDEANYKLAPRGMRGDTAILAREEAYTPQFQMNIDLLFEVLSADEFVRVATGQVTNQRALHPALSTITNPTGEPIERIVVEQEFTEQGFVVGQEVQQGEGRFSEKRTIIERAVAPKRATLPGTEDRPIPTISMEIAPEQQSAMLAQQNAEMAALAAADAVARQRGPSAPQGLAGGLTGFNVVTPSGMPTAVETRFDDGQMNPTDRRPQAPIQGQQT